MLLAIMLIILVILVVATALIVLRYRRYLAKLHPILAKTYQDLAESNASLAKTQQELNESNASLAKTQQELNESNASLEKTQQDLAKTQQELNEAVASLGLKEFKRTPAQGFVLPELIPEYRSKRVRTTYGGCFMCRGIFVKSDNNLGCSCQTGYYWSLGDISKIDMGEFIRGPLIQYIRESFKEGYEPFGFCKDCISRSTNYPEADPDNPCSSDDQNLTIHIEPSNRCNLRCEACLCTDERNSINPPKRVLLEYDTFHKMLSEIKSAGLNVKVVAFVGFGEPLFNSELPAMAKLARSIYQDCFIYLDTNANFGLKRAEEISNCGIDEVRLGLDGVDQVTYEAYRKGGDFDRAIKFSQKLVETIRQNSSGTRVVWKYILFKHNDKDEHIFRAIEMANAMGIELAFDLTAGEWASTRPLSEIQLIVKSKKIGMNLDEKFIAIHQDQAQ